MINNNNSPAFPKTDYFCDDIFPPEPPIIRENVPAKYKPTRKAFKNRCRTN